MKVGLPIEKYFWFGYSFKNNLSIKAGGAAGADMNYSGYALKTGLAINIVFVSLGLQGVYDKFNSYESSVLSGSPSDLYSKFESSRAAVVISFPINFYWLHS